VSGARQQRFVDLRQRAGADKGIRYISKDSPMALLAATVVDEFVHRDGLEPTPQGALASIFSQFRGTVSMVCDAIGPKSVHDFIGLHLSRSGAAQETDQRRRISVVERLDCGVFMFEAAMG
jgi:hypothetical protein